jgi:hypothetical protein
MTRHPGAVLMLLVLLAAALTAVALVAPALELVNHVGDALHNFDPASAGR